jgi:hypothetical protein
MRGTYYLILLAGALIGSLAIAGCGDDEGDGADEEGICFYSCDEGFSMTSIEGVTKSECNESAETDDWCDVVDEVVFEAGCTDCEACAPDWYECW